MRQPKSVRDGEPVVAHLERAAELLGVDAGKLGRAIAAARLEPWGVDAAQRTVWRWRELVGAATDAGLPVPARVLRHGWRKYPTRRKVSPYGRETEQEP